MGVFLFFASIILYYSAPTQYNWSFCFVCFCVFVVSAYGGIKHDTKNINTLNFNLLFAISFFLCSYAFALFIYPSGESGLIGIAIGERNINVCTSICTCAFSAYSYGYLGYFRIKNKKTGTSIINNYGIEQKTKRLYLLLVPIIIAILVFFMRTEHEVAIEVTTTPYLFVIFTDVSALLFSCYNYTRTSHLMSLQDYVSKNRIVICGSLIIMLFYLVIGDRKIIIELGLMLLGAYSLFHKKLNFKKLFVLLLSGIFLMSMVGITRNETSSLREGGLNTFLEASNTELHSQNNYWSYFSDLTERYEELYFGYQYTQEKGSQYPLKIVPYIFSPVPLLPNVSCMLIYGIPLAETSVGLTIGQNMFSDRITHSGSHCVIDTYMPWGILGTIVVFFLFGLFVRHITDNVYTNIYYSVIYIILLSQSFFLARSSLFDVYRNAAWCIFIIYIFNRTSRNN